MPKGKKKDRVDLGADVSPIPADASRYVNREFALLAFFWRVLEEAQDESNPLLERVRFLGIVGSILSEFFMTRVAVIKQQIAAGVLERSLDGLLPGEQFVAVRAESQKLMDAARACLRDLTQRLAEHGIHICDYAQLGPDQREALQRYFETVAFPVLTPLAYDPGHPFPHISNMSLNLAVLIRTREGQSRFGRVKIPATLPRLLRCKPPADHPESALHLVWVEQVIAAHLGMLFPGMEIIQVSPFRVTRDAEVAIQELEAEDLLETIERGVRKRRFGDVVRMTIPPDMPEALRVVLMENLELAPEDVYTVESPLGTSDLMGLYSSLDFPELKFPPFVPYYPAILDQEEDTFSALRRQDILLQHPYDSFSPVLEFLQEAARDPAVLAIKITLYRVGKNAPVVQALLDAIRQGKQVAILVEIKARFDEESNIEWAKQLESEGVHVIYGLLGYKTHSKVALVVRAEGETIRRYLHLSTGNYNATTAQQYTDLGLLTCDEQMGADASDLFNYLTGYSAKTDYCKFLVAPINMRSKLEELIQREMDLAARGEPAHLIFKTNSLIDKPMIDLLYRASHAGVRIDLLIRGVCSLRPSVPGLSENIRVVSVVGRFLEHSRIYYFRNGGREEVYLGSADLRTRNLDRRVEILFPLESPQLIRHVRDVILAAYLADNVKARLMQPDGSYQRATPAPGAARVNSQESLLYHAGAHPPEPITAPGTDDT